MELFLSFNKIDKLYLFLTNRDLSNVKLASTIFRFVEKINSGDLIGKPKLVCRKIFGSIKGFIELALIFKKAKCSSAIEETFKNL